LFGLMGAKPAVVLISVEKSKCNINKDDDESNQAGENEDEARKKLETFLSGLLDKMNIKFSNVETSFKDDLINVHISSRDSSFIIGKNGQTLDSIEYLTQIVVNKDFNSRLKINLDCENYRKKQQDRLKILTDKAIDYVKNTGEPYYFDPMSAKERKTIHLYLKNNQFVESFSEGEDPLRKVLVKPAKHKTKV
ncbi:MAG: KH domain-containing protein, partial [Endomicrobium sp.]|nr:KH domain-containing protein [Endomicrobium sp.]